MNFKAEFRGAVRLFAMEDRNDMWAGAPDMLTSIFWLHEPMDGDRHQVISQVNIEEFLASDDPEGYRLEKDDAVLKEHGIRVLEIILPNGEAVPIAEGRF